jgi:hypothetical protein
MSLTGLRQKYTNYSFQDQVDKLMKVRRVRDYYVSGKQDRFIRRQQEVPEICREHCDYWHEKWDNVDYDKCVARCLKEAPTQINM